MPYNIPIGAALHQWPREKDLRALIVPPEGHLLVEFDASGQEMRFMAALSGCESMQAVFNADSPYNNAHSRTGAAIMNISFERFVELKEADNDAVTGPHGGYKLGKLCNLSSQYRIGANSLRAKARVDYDMRLSYEQVQNLQKTYHKTYPGVKRYWNSAIYRAKQLGYAETLGGRRFYIDCWRGDDVWSSESSAINFPIQGSGADMKELALSMMTRYFPHFTFAFDLHDGLFFYLEKNPDAEKMILQARDALGKLPYKKAWEWDPPIPMPWDAAYGESWGDMEEL